MPEALPNAVADSLGLSADLLSHTPIRSGPIAIGRLEHSDRAFFYKRTSIDNSGPLRAEALGLDLLAGSKPAIAPALYTCIDLQRETWLVIEWIDLRPLSDTGSARLGAALASLHREATADRHGLEQDNWIGATPQVNSPSADWTDFFFKQRLGAMTERLNAAGMDFGTAVIDRLKERWTAEFPDYAPVPSLLHGDLWGGNAGERPNGIPVIFDPSVHYGDRECDLAMASLFGGFGARFFDVYQAAWPLQPDWQLRRDYYQLYHVLNHALLFGGGYVADARRRITGLIDR